MSCGTSTSAPRGARSPLAIRVLASARREIDEADVWWRANREDRDAIRREFRRFCELVAAFPELGTQLETSRISARRLLLPAIDIHVYYRVRPRANRIEVLSFWHARRGSRPAL